MKLKAKAEETPSLIIRGDNLVVMKSMVKDRSVDLVYLDPPFKTNRDHDMLFRKKTRAQKSAPGFSDVWKWDETTEAEFDRVKDKTLESLFKILGKSDMTAYLVMMAPRLAEMKRVMKKGAAIHLHVDPATSHYIKILMDSTFGPKNFKNEIVWHYRRWTNAQKQFQKMHDVILFYRNGPGGTFNLDETDPAPSQARVIERGWNVNKVNGPGGKLLQLLVYDRKKFERAVAEKKVDPSHYDRVIYRDTVRSALSDTWTDIQFLHSQATERVGYPTQKPLALLERIIRTCTDPGDLVLDPFCGAGTTLVASARLGRRFIGVDMNREAVKISDQRIREEFGEVSGHRLAGFSEKRA